jgi:hypothetical protein
MGENRFTRDAYAVTAKKVEAAGGDTSHAGRQHKREGKGIHPLVDPKGYDLVRKSLPRHTQGENGLWQLTVGEPMLLETRFDTTGSMGGNVKLAFSVLPATYDLVSKVLGRYDPQLLNAIFGDVADDVVLYRSQAEMAEKIAEQLTLMVPEGRGGDTTEDPDYGLFGAAYLTQAHINRYGLKYYDLTVTDAPGRGRISHTDLVRVYGDSVYERVRENGHEVTAKQLPTTAEIVSDLKKQAHAFVLLVGPDGITLSQWQGWYGKEYVIQADSTACLHYYQALIAGLTEGTLDLQSATEFLCDNGCVKDTARDLVRSVSHIPLGAQQRSENFDKIPLKGAYFKEKTDLWPIDPDEVGVISMEQGTEGGVDWA